MNFKEFEHEYNEKLPTYQRLKEEAVFILERALDRKQIKVHLIPARVKGLNSFWAKVQRKEFTNPFLDVTDIVGLRVVCLFLSDVPSVGEVIRECFHVLSEDNKILGYDVASFGYMSVHFIVEMKQTYSGPRYDELSGIPLEIQVRTLSMDAWDTVSHYLDYKTENDVPKELRRDFYALSGLFYVADSHFEMFYKARQASTKQTTERFRESKKRPPQEINLDTLTAFMQTRFPNRRHADPKTVSDLVTELIGAGYTSIADVEDIVRRAHEAMELWEKESPPLGFLNLNAKDRSKSAYTTYNDVGALRTCFKLVKNGDQYGSIPAKYKQLVKE